MIAMVPICHYALFVLAPPFLRFFSGPLREGTTKIPIKKDRHSRKGTTAFCIRIPTASLAQHPDPTDSNPMPHHCSSRENNNANTTSGRFSDLHPTERPLPVHTNSGMIPLRLATRGH